MDVASAVGQLLVEHGVRQAFGVVGSGNFHATNAMIEAGARFVATRHEGGAATMADAYGRMSGELPVLSVHQGCGLTNAMTGIGEAAKSGTPLIVLAAQATQPRSNFYVDQEKLAESVGAQSLTIHAAADAPSAVGVAVNKALGERKTVVLNLPIDLLANEVPSATSPIEIETMSPLVPSSDDVDKLVDALRAASRPVFVAGRGARGPGAGASVRDLADRVGALLATSAVAKGLFNDSPWSLGISGGFSSPLAADLIKDADLIVGWGCALNMWTMRHGRLIGEKARVIQVDDDPEAIGAQRPIAEGVVGDVRETARIALSEITNETTGYRSAELSEQLRSSVKWRDVPYEDRSTSETIDPRTLTTALDDLLPAERVVSVDSGNFMGWPSAFLDVPDEWGFCFTQAFQSIGLGLATAVGAALAQPDRIPVAALGDGGSMMAIAEMDTVVRLGLPMVVVVYNDNAYGAEVHHFGPDGHDLSTVEFPPTDIAAIARGFGFEGLTVRSVDDLGPFSTWLAGDRDRPILLDAKIESHASWWLEEAFGH